jgi:drug/metabolite transporter (DMT)-like permease
MKLSGDMIDRRAALAAGVTVVLWASAFVGIRDLADIFSPGSIAVGRLIIGTLLLGVLLWRRGWTPVGRRDLVLIALSGVLWYALYNVALNEAERHVDAGTASMLVNTGPILVALFAGLFLGEGLPRRLIVGLAIAFAGALVIGLATSQAASGSGQGSAELGGIALCFVAAGAYSAGVTLQKPATRNVPALQLTWTAFAVALVVCLPFLPGLVSEVGAVAATPAATQKLGWLLYLGIFPTSIGFTSWAYALSRTSAGKLGITTYLTPPVAIVISWVLLAEVPPVLALVGGVLCIVGVVVVRAQGLFRSRSSATPLAEAS